MFKLVVLFVLVAVAIAAPKPGYLQAAYSAPLLAHSAYAVPTAVSHQSRVDVHSSPVIATSYSAPAYVAAPAIHAYAAAPLAVHHHSLPTAVSHSSRYDIHRTAAVISTPIHGYAAPLSYGYAAPGLNYW